MNIRHTVRSLRAAVSLPVLIVSSLLPISTVYAGGPSSFCDSTGAPVADMSTSSTQGVQTLTVTFDGSYSEACTGTITNYSWDFGDGTTATGETVTHTYGVGTWTPKLTVTNSSNLSNSTSGGSGITVKADNTAPIAVNDSAEVPQGVETVIAAGANDSDPDGDPLSWQLATNPVHGAIVAYDANGNFTYVSDSNYAGADSFTYTASDGFGGVTTATVNLTVDPHVVAQDDTATTPETTAVTIPVLANDSAVDGDPLTITFAGMTSGDGSIAVSSDGQSIVYTPVPGWAGTAVFRYTVADANETQYTANANVTVNVTPVNQPPVANNASFSAPANTSITGNVLNYASDPDGDTLTATALTQPFNGVLVMNADGTFTYTPNTNYFGVDSFTYQVTDPSGATAQATVALDVTYVNQPPVAQDDSVTTPEDTAATVRVLTNDTDPDGDSLHVTGITTGPSHGTAVVNSDGTITYTPAANYNGTDSFVYQIADSAGATSTATVTITVTPVNDPPTASFTWTVGSRRSVNFTASASDIDGTVVRYDWSFGDGTTAANAGANVQHSYKKSGNYIVTLTVTDNQGAQTSYQQTISL